MIEPTSVNVVIYHADCTDGFGAAYSAWKQLGNRAEYLEVLTTQRDVLESKLDLFELKKSQFLSLINVYKAVGGGWK